MDWVDWVDWEDVKDSSNYLIIGGLGPEDWRSLEDAGG